VTPTRVSIAAAFALAWMAVAAPGLPAPARPALKAASVPEAAAAAAGAWTTYHHDNAHTGFDSTQPAAGGATAGWTSPTLDGQVYGEPLVFNGLVYVGTLAGTVYALNQSTGATAWFTNVGAPQPVLSGQCGNVNPLGILGTPVIDTTAGRIYVSEIRTTDKLWHVYGIDLTSHAIVLDDVIPNNIGTGFDWTIEQQRGALALSKDRSQVYVPFGGRAGDCGPYHGWVVGVPTSGTGAPTVYESPSMASGIWAGGGVVVDDATGNVLFATGNAIPCSGAVNSDSVIRTGASLGAALDFFQPNDWSPHWCIPDWDLGSASPTIISPTLAFTSGKYGQGFLFNPTNLGGLDGQLFPAKTPYVGADVCAGNHADATFGSFAYAAPRIYLECDNHGLVSLTVNTSTPSFSLCDSSCTAAGTWQAGGSTTFGPPIVAGGVVWAVDIGGSGLYGFDAATGAQVYQSGAFGVNHFSTPSEAGGQVFVSAGTQVRSFNMGLACSGITATAAPPATATVGTPVTVTGTASPDCPNPRYEFWLKSPGGAWKDVRPYSPTNTYSWPTAGLAPGSYLFSVWARDAGSAGTGGTPPNSYDAFTTVAYTLTVTACTSMSASAAPPSPSSAGTPVTITGNATPCSNPRYEFWLKPPGGAWKIVKPYSISNSYSWPTSGLPAGSYLFSVWARDAGSPGTSGTPPNTYDSFATVQYNLTVTACTAMTASAVPPSPATAGTPIRITGSATCPNPLYEFWLLPPGGAWKLVQHYSNNPSFDWKTVGLVPGSYLFSVWARDASSPGTHGTAPNRYDTFATVQYKLT
jgi:hypothetical protein